MAKQEDNTITHTPQAHTKELGRLPSAFFLSMEHMKQYTNKPDVREKIIKEVSLRLNKLVSSWYGGTTLRTELENRLEISQRVRNARISKQISTESLADKTHIDPVLIILLENGLASSEEIEQVQGRIAEALGLDTSELLVKHNA